MPSIWIVLYLALDSFEFCAVPCRVVCRAVPSARILVFGTVGKGFPTHPKCESKQFVNNLLVFVDS